jgi:hypothetical protein
MARLRNDLELIELMRTKMLFVDDPSLNSAEAKLQRIAAFIDDYNNTNQDTVEFAPELKIVIERILDGKRPVKLVYLTDFDGEAEPAESEA